MYELSIDPEFLRRLMQQLRAVFAVEGVAAPRVQGDDADDESASPLIFGGDDMRVEEIREEIDAMEDDHQYELVALMWLGRGDFTEDEWPDALELAADRRVGPTSDYILSHPLAPDEIALGLEMMGHSHVLLDGAY